MSASPSTAVGWCAVEALALLALHLVAEGGRWRFHVAGGDGAAMSLVVVHGLLYLSMLAAPFPIFR